MRLTIGRWFRFLVFGVLFSAIGQTAVGEELGAMEKLDKKRREALILGNCRIEMCNPRSTTGSYKRALALNAVIEHLRTRLASSTPLDEADFVSFRVQEFPKSRFWVRLLPYDSSSFDETETDFLRANAFAPEVFAVVDGMRWKVNEFHVCYERKGECTAIQRLKDIEFLRGSGGLQ
jgi:hypothetical protein